MRLTRVSCGAQQEHKFKPRVGYRQHTSGPVHTSFPSNITHCLLVTKLTIYHYVYYPHRNIYPALHARAKAVLLHRRIRLRNDGRNHRAGNLHSSALSHSHSRSLHSSALSHSRSRSLQSSTLSHSRSRSLHFSAHPRSR